MKAFHIRRRLKKQRGNQFYKDYSDRDNGTYCGAEYGDHDIDWRGKAESFKEWYPCPQCVAIRDAEKNEEGDKEKRLG